MSVDVSTRRPINRQSAKILWRAPWWARLDEVPQRAKIIIPPNEWELFADIFAPPPSNDAKDRRGTRVKFFNGNELGIVTGFQSRKKVGGKNQYVWWCMLEDGAITTIRFNMGKAARFEEIS